MRDKRKHLTPSERRLLEHLVRNAGRVVSHKELLEAMSPGNRTTSIDNLRHYILRLRKKVEVAPALPGVIITHYGQRYSLAGKEDSRWFPQLEPPMIDTASDDSKRSS